MEKSPLRVFREKLKLTQQDLADMLDISRNYVTLIETGAKPMTPKIVKKLAEYDACMKPPPPEPDQSKMSKDERIAHLENKLAKAEATIQELLEINRKLAGAVDRFSATLLPGRQPQKENEP